MTHYTKNNIEKLVCFKRWQKKGFAAFSSLRRSIKIGVISVVYTILNLQIVDAQTTDTIPQHIDLEEVEVAADFIPFAVPQLLQLNAAAILSLPAQGHSDLLAYFPQIDVRKRGPFDIQSDISINGTTFDQSIILLNGINISDPHTGHYSHILPLSTDDIKNVELLPNAYSFLHGNPIGGVIQYHTKKDLDTSSLQLSADYGSFNYFRTAVRGNLATNHYHQSFSASYAQSDGHAFNTDFQQINAFTEGNILAKNAPISFLLGFSQKNAGANAFYGAKYKNQYDEPKIFFANIQSKHVFNKLSISPLAYWRGNWDHYILNRDNPAAYQNFHNSNIIGGHVLIRLAHRFGAFHANPIYRYESILSSSLGTPMQNEKPVIGNPAQSYKFSYARHRLSLSLLEKLSFSDFSLAAALLVDYTQATKLQFYPSVNLEYRPLSCCKIALSAQRNSRLPSFTDMFYKSPINVANANLLPEFAWQYALETAMSLGDFSAQLTVFHRRMTDAIDWIWIDEKWQTLNYTALNSTGISLQARYLAQPGKFIKRASIAYSYLTSDKDETGFISNYALDYLRHRLIFSLEHKIVHNLSINYSVKFNDRNGTYLALDENNSESIQPFAPYTYLDVKLSYPIRNIFIYTELSNILNTRAQEIGNIPLPQFNFRFGISYTFKKS